MIKSFILLQSRPEDETSDDEYDAFCRYCHLEPVDLVRYRMDKGEFPDESVITEASGVIMGGAPPTYATPDKSDGQIAFEQRVDQILKLIIARDIPFLGICYGVGALTNALGGKTSFDYGESLASVRIQLTAEGQADDLFAGVPDNFLAIVGHKEGTNQEREGVTVLARNDRCIQAVKVGANVYGTQFHPELDEAGLRVRTNVYRYRGYFDPETIGQTVTQTIAGEPYDSRPILTNFVQIYSKER